MARGDGHLPVADVRYLARGKDARSAGVIDLARGKDARGAGVIDLARGMDICLWQM